MYYNKFRFLFLLFVISLFLRISFISFFVKEPVNSPDALNYISLGTNLAQGKGYLLIPPKNYRSLYENFFPPEKEYTLIPSSPTTLLPPGYPFFIAIIYFFFGENPYIILFFQGIIDSFTSLLIYLLCRKIFSHKVALVNSFFYVLYPGFIQSTGNVLSETLFMFLLNLSIIFLLQIKEKKSIKFSFLSGIIIGISSLVRPFILLLPFLLFFWFFIENKKNILKFFLLYFIFWLGILLTIIPWTLRNYIITKRIIPISAHGGFFFWATNTPEARGLWLSPDKLAPDKMKEMEHKINTGEISSYGYKKGYEFLKQLSFLELITHFSLKIFYLINPFTSSGYFIWLGTFLPFVIMGLFIFYKKSDRDLILFYPLFNLIIMTLVFCSQLRYLLPFIPYLNVFALYVFEDSLGKSKRKFLFFLFTTLWFAINLFLYLKLN